MEAAAQPRIPRHTSSTSYWMILVSALTVVFEVLVLLVGAKNKNVFALLSALSSGLGIYMLIEAYKKRGKAGGELLNKHHIYYYFEEAGGNRTWHRPTPIETISLVISVIHLSAAIFDFVRIQSRWTTNKAFSKYPFSYASIALLVLLVDYVCSWF